MYKVLCLIELNDRQKSKISSMSDDLSVEFNTKPSEAEIASADIILGNPSPELVSHNKGLLWMQTQSAGVDGYIKPGVLPENCVLTNATGAYGLAISEHMLGMYLEIIKKLNLYRDVQKSGQWVDFGEVKSVNGSTVLVVGMGDIGGKFAALCKAMGARVIGVRRRDNTVPEYCDELYLTENLDTILPEADCVAIALPGTAETKGMFSAERIAKMKDGAVLLNVGRGYIVDTEALCDALESGKLSGAGLDVTDPEPLPKDHRLWNIPSAVITPHVSGGDHLENTVNTIADICAENLGRFIRGEKLKNIVDFSTGYRKL